MNVYQIILSASEIFWLSIRKRIGHDLLSSIRSLLDKLRFYTTLARKHRVPLGIAFRRRRYYASWVRPQPVPLCPASYLPDEFCVRKLANTGVSIVENFCTTEEAANLINSAQGQLEPSTMVVNRKRILTNRRTSETATVFSETKANPLVLPLLYRGAMLTGLPCNNAEAVYVTRYQAGQMFDSHTDFYPGFEGDRLYTILIYLNDVPQNAGGATIFPDLNLSVQPKVGRAITWTNKNPDGSIHPETRHAALPVLGKAQKWVIQLWFRRYKMFETSRLFDFEGGQRSIGTPLNGDEIVPNGISTLANVSDRT